jgi:hypothetical protein
LEAATRTTARMTRTTASGQGTCGGLSGNLRDKYPQVPWPVTNSHPNQESSGWTMQLEAATMTTAATFVRSIRSNVKIPSSWTILISRFLSDQQILLLIKVSAFMRHCVRRKLWNNRSLFLLQGISNDDVDYDNFSMTFMSGPVKSLVLPDPNGDLASCWGCHFKQPGLL